MNVLFDVIAITVSIIHHTYQVILFIHGWAHAVSWLFLTHFEVSTRFTLWVESKTGLSDRWVMSWLLTCLCSKHNISCYVVPFTHVVVVVAIEPLMYIVKRLWVNLGIPTAQHTYKHTHTHTCSVLNTKIINTGLHVAGSRVVMETGKGNVSREKWVMGVLLSMGDGFMCEHAQVLYQYITIIRSLLFYLGMLFRKMQMSLRAPCYMCTYTGTYTCMDTSLIKVEAVHKMLGVYPLISGRSKMRGFRYESTCTLYY